MPPQKAIGPNQKQSARPRRRSTREQQQSEPVLGTQPWALDLAANDNKLMAQQLVLGRDLARRTDVIGEGTEQKRGSRAGSVAPPAFEEENDAFQGITQNASAVGKHQPSSPPGVALSIVGCWRREISL